MTDGIAAETGGFASETGGIASETISIALSEISGMYHTMENKGELRIATVRAR